MASSDLLTRARDLWRGRLIDLTRNNQLLYYKPLKVGTIELAAGPNEAADRILGGSDVPLTRLADGLAPGAVETVERRFLEIRRKAIENEEERGLKTLYLAVGLATWTAADGGRPPTAPIILVPIERADDRQKQAVRRSGDPEPNLAMVHVLETEFGCAGLGDALEDIDPNEAPEHYASAVHAELQRRAGGVPGFSVIDQTVISNFSFQKMAMVRDLDALAPQMAGNAIINAMAGDLEAAAQLLQTGPPLDARDLDRQSPDAEFTVLPADSSQQLVIAHVVRGDSGVIIGPPGTGKSQTISNVIAELAARGQSVRFVAEKRAALDAVKKRLLAVGLGHMVLDLHGTVTKKELMRQFGDAIAAIEGADAVDTTALHDAFTRSRSTLVQHDARMHTPLPPAGLTLFELQGRLVNAPSVADTGVTFGGPQMAALTPEGIGRATEALRQLTGVADLVLGQSASPWARAAVQTPGQAEEAGALAGRLSGEMLQQLAACTARCVDELGLQQPANLTEVGAVAHLSVDLAALLATYDPAILTEDLPGLAAALGPARRGIVSRWNGRYRAAVKHVRALRRQAVSPRQMLDEITLAAAAMAAWFARAGRRPPVASSGGQDLVACLDGFGRALTELSAYVSLPDLSTMALHELDGVLRPLAQDRLTPMRLARMAELLGELDREGFTPLVSAVRSRGVPAEFWLHALNRAVWSSTVMQAQLRDGSLAAFSGRMLDSVVEEFRRTDEIRTQCSAARVSRAHGLAAVETMNAHADQTSILRRQSQLKTRHRSLRQVMLEAADVAMALKPCWMASPLSVSQLLGGGQAYFDVVIFDEASQVLPEDAVAALMRGRSAVVAGDPKQLPPTTFFASRTDSDDAAGSDSVEDDVAGFESVLDLLAATFRPWDLEWHYRSKDERLIAFSNEYIYHRSLVTFPGPGLSTPVRHVLVDKRTGDADEESSAAEVEAVAGLVRDHAHRDAGEGTQRSLGVIAMGIKHARRIEARVEEMRREDPVLDTFLSRPGDDRFFVKNLERVQGDERESIVLSIGYGKDASGRLPYRFGPLLTQGGERRLNVAITRASHEMTLVSSFSHLDMDPARSNSEGVKLLRAYLEYMAGGGMSLVHETMTAFEENAFERDIAEALTAVGIRVVPQYGVSRYRIDMVTRHPQREGVLVLAIECDGATYHSSPTARDRDRLRQLHLEALGWRFCRIWSTDWFLDRATELRRVVAAHERRLQELAEAGTGGARVAHVVDNVVALPRAVAAAGAARGPRPPLQRGLDIGFYNPADLDRLVRWLRSDGRLRTDDQLLDEAMDDLGFHRHGARIDAALRSAVERTRQSA